MNTTRIFAWLAPLALTAFTLTGCGSDETEPTPASKTTPDPTPLFTADAPTSGARMWLEVTDADGPVVVSLWASELGGTFGWAAHVTFDPAALTASAASLDEAVLGGPQAAHVLAPKSGDVAFGAARRGTALGEVEIDQPTLLGSFQLDGEGASRLDIDRVVVRRADGSFVAVTTAGGELDTREDGGAS